MFRAFIVLLGICLLSACGGGGGSSSVTTYSAPNPVGALAPASNVVPLVIDSGPASLNTNGSSGIVNVGYVTVTLCAPGSTTNCQAIDHVMVDTGSVGLRVIASVLNPSLLAALPVQSDGSSHFIQECMQYLDGFVWGSVRTADVTLSGESAPGLPIQTISDGMAGIPSSCSNSGGKNEGTVSTFLANGIIGIGPFSNDCGTACAQGTTTTGGYYACTGSGNTAVCSPTAQGASISAPNQQVANPILSFAQDNNGSMISMPAVSPDGQATATGSLVFGIGTQSNNGLGSARVYTLSAPHNVGYFTTAFNGNTMPYSYVDSGTSLLVFNSSLTQCSLPGYSGFYCPATPTALTAVNSGLNSNSGTVGFTIGNTESMTTSNAVLPELGLWTSDTTSFAWGMPFFYGRQVFTAIKGASTPGGTGPYFAY